MCVWCILFYVAIEGTSRISSVGRALDCRAGSRGFDPLRRTNRPFYRHGGHIELLRFKEYCGMSRGGGGAWARSDILAQYVRAHFGPIFLYGFLEKDCNGEKKILVPCLDVIMIAFFPRNIQWSSLFARKARVNTERVPPGHPIILLKPNKFKMTSVSVKRSILRVLKITMKVLPLPCELINLRVTRITT